MTRDHPWSDGYVAAVAWHATFNYRFSWNRLRDVDAGLSIDEIDSLLGELEAAGNDIGPDTPPSLLHGAGLERQVQRLFELTGRARAAVSKAFAGPGAIPDQVWAYCAFPRSYMALPGPGLANEQEVELIHLGDLPPHTPEWRDRATLSRYTSLRVLALFNMRLGAHGLGADLTRLPRLICLDLRENGFTAVPPEVLQCASLEWLDIGDNPIGTLPDLDSLPRLRYLGTGRTHLPASALAGLRARRSELTVGTGE